jgi:hypothetical protein
MFWRRVRRARKRVIVLVLVRRRSRMRARSIWTADARPHTLDARNGPLGRVRPAFVALRGALGRNRPNVMIGRWLPSTGMKGA